MSAEVHDDISVAAVTATPERDPVAPLGFAEAVVWAQHFWNAWWLMPIATTVVVPCARAATYCILDFLLVLLAHACGDKAHLRETFRAFQPFSRELMALWGRARMPSQSQMSRWLARIDDSTLASWRTLFYPTSAATA